jgi:allantoate deiminase
LKPAITLEAQSLENRQAETVLARCDALAKCTDQDGMILRTFLSPAMDDCLRMVRSWMEAAGMQVSIDLAGNLRGYYQGTEPEAPRLVIASHLDTVPNAGRYDGILGVMLGIALVETLAGKHLSFGIEIIGFSDEEGVRYGLPFLGSRAMVGELTSEHGKLLDSNGIPLDAALGTFAVAHREAVASTLDPTACAYLEFHIEQGPVLEDAGLGLAVVESIAGQSRATVTFRGRAGHAGTTPMSLRQDALTATAEWLLAVESAAASTPGLVASTGRIVCEPGATNIIPGTVSCTLDVRSSSDELRRSSVQSMLESAQRIATRRRVTVRYTLEADQLTVNLDEPLTRLAEKAISAAQMRATRLVSGAGHDAMILAPHLPAAMIFLRSPGGISHPPDEAVLVQDVAAAVRAGIHFLDGFPHWLESELRTCNT